MIPKAPIGFLNLNKPAGMTSRDAINRVQRAFRPQKIKIGHAGTLDPLATGVLMVAVGRATRLIAEVQNQTKVYKAVFKLGCQSPTEDTEGEVTELVNPPIPSQAELQAALEQWTGTIQQIPPAFSALKVNGKRAYDLARKGKQVDLEPREVEIKQLVLLNYHYPRFEVKVECSAGTYIRSLGRDIAQTLQTESVMINLIRTAIGDFQIENSLELAKQTKKEFCEALVPPIVALPHLEKVSLPQEQTLKLLQGQILSRFERSVSVQNPEKPFALITPKCELLSIVQQLRNGDWKAERSFVSAVEYQAMQAVS
ncbi:tRNA pseudouridine synthase B [Planctomycetales bacterium 10988]|nr:tRNA pseudouridine synthase B [Planctomycetales bacterium 10988]